MRHNLAFCTKKKKKTCIRRHNLDTWRVHSDRLIDDSGAVPMGACSTSASWSTFDNVFKAFERSRLTTLYLKWAKETETK